eukprot:TRINITY_DN21653_c0_g1_i1.p1 TRINITY_DN21653_c0_g1~~TRINITY_DN21653_c0_g1_i1.p1  ORF type:complete len:503 (-),score=71.04 TRINITY_DN21653_c0_g1_i1:158-1666(-)
MFSAAESLAASTFATYPTPKVVRIISWKLALLRYSLLLLVFLFIFLNQILLRGNHLRTVSLSGNAQISVHLPTIGNCDSFLSDCNIDFTPLDKLRYCKQGQDRIEDCKQCVYRDPTELSAASGPGQDALIPTNIRTFVQRRKCFPSEYNDWSCPDGIFEFVNEDGSVHLENDKTQPWSDLFVADVERFRLLLDHSALSDGGVNAESFQMSGTWLNCTAHHGTRSCRKEPILCFSSGCAHDPEHHQASLELLKGAAPVATKEGITKALNNSEEGKAKSPAKSKSRRRRRSPQHLPSLAAFESEEEEPETFDDLESRYIERAMENNLAVSLQKGDIFPVSLLLKMAGVSLDGLPALRNKSTYRAEGFSVTIRVHYTNIRPWVGLHVLPWMTQERQGLRYSVEAIRHPSQAFKRRVVSEENKNLTSGHLLGRRVVEEDHGISIVVQQYGDMKVWDFGYTLVILTTTLAMLAVSNCILDAVAFSCMEKSHEYQQLKYEDALDLEGT